MHDWLRIIGLYSNVPEGGQFADEQLRWLTEELRAAPQDVTVILAMHQPVYAVDITHGSNLTLAEALEGCFADAGRAPDAVFTGHAHNYQRFARRLGDRQIPYIVAGAGGYYERHAIAEGVSALPASFPGLNGVTLEAYEDETHGFMTVTVTPAGAEVAYTAVSEGSAAVVDSFRIAARPPYREGGAAVGPARVDDTEPVTSPSTLSLSRGDGLRAAAAPGSASARWCRDGI